ncbi:MAG TPA: hypothetical protein VN228_13445, partial [Pyrinomonadaceae bacterium]|nr:hypothetical protein [Pyrinomonadaceae bacterium]
HGGGHAAYVDVAALPDWRLKVEPHLKLTAFTAELWREMEASPEPEVLAGEGGSRLRLYYDGLSFEKELPPLAAGRRGAVSAFRTVETLIEGYNRLVLRRASGQPAGRGIVRAIGGFDEGLLQIGMIFDALTQAHAEREGGLMPPDRLEAAVRDSYVTVRSLTQLNYFPQKILDELIVIDINPFTAPRAPEGERARAGAEVRAEVWEFLGALAEELFANPAADLSGRDPRATFEFVLTRLDEIVCGPEDRGRELRGHMLRLYARVFDAVGAELGAGAAAAGSPFFKAMIKKLLTLRVGTMRPPYTQRDALTVLQRTTFAVKIVELFAGYREGPENRFTIGCTALRAGILKRWYERLSGVLVRWYRLEHERQAAPSSTSSAL